MRVKKKKKKKKGEEQLQQQPTTTRNGAVGHAEREEGKLSEKKKTRVETVIYGRRTPA